SATNAPYSTETRPMTIITQAQARHASGRIGIAMRTKPYVPILSSTPASTAEPVEGASVWAGGSHGWDGRVGGGAARPTPTAARTGPRRTRLSASEGAW